MAVITIKIAVTDIENVLTLFDRIQVQRSKAGDPYSDAELITADEAAAPSVTGTVEGPYIVNGDTLILKVDGGTDQTVTFEVEDPASLAPIIEELNDKLVGITASNSGDKLQLTGDTLGTGGTLEVVGGSSVSDFGVSGLSDQGEDANVELLTGVEEYTFNDSAGDVSYWYSTRFYNSLSGAYSSWSDWIQGAVETVISASYLITGKIKLADIDGTALVGQKVTLVNIFSPLTTDSYFLAGRSKQIETDGLGQAEIDLVKGAQIDVIVEGTSLIRRIEVPDTGSEFDLLDDTLVVDDAFGIQTPDLPAAVRRS